MAGDLLSISVSGLNLSQTALRTAGHNISNADTEGYTRQSVTSTANPATYSGGAFVGSGVNVASVERKTNQFVINQLRDDTSLYNEQKTFLDSMNELDNMLSNPSIGLSDSLQRFYSSLQAASDDPTSIAARQLVIGEADGLVSRINNLYDRFEQMEEGLDQKMTNAVNKANVLIDSIAQLNLSIAKNIASGAGSPNDLLDKRDQAITELAEIVGIQVNDYGDGMVAVSLKGGDPLVLSGQTKKLSLESNSSSFGRLQVAVLTDQGPKIVSNQISGGELGGIVRFRDQMLDKAFNDIGRISVGLSASFNQIHQQGIDLNGDFGAKAFTDINDPALAAGRVLQGEDNKPPYNRVLALEITDPAQLTNSDYRVKIEEGSQRFSIVRVSDGVEVVSNLLTGRTPQNVEFDGLKMTFLGGQFQQGDEFYLQPTRGMSKELAFNIDQPEELAFAKALVGGNSLGNLGTGAISNGDIVSVSAVSSATDLPIFQVPGDLNPPLLVRFNSPTRFDVLDNSDPSNPVQLDPPIRNKLFVPSTENELFGADIGETVVTSSGSRIAQLSQDDNGYPAERFTFTTVIDASVGSQSVESVIIPSGSSASDIAAMLGNVPGVSVTAFTEGYIKDVSGIDFTASPQIKLNGENLIAYDGSNLNLDVPTTDSEAFMDYLAEQINSNPQLSASGITAKVVTHEGIKQLRLYSDDGSDLKLEVVDSTGASNLVFSNGSDTSSVLANDGATFLGGQFDIRMADGVSLKTLPPVSGLVGDSTADDVVLAEAKQKGIPVDPSKLTFAKQAFLGIQATVNGKPQEGDTFTISYNASATTDNRNAMSLAELNITGVLNNGRATLSDLYGVLVENVGITTGTAKINAEASQGVWEQSDALRNSLAGVNLDEEAANLIRYEQMYSANAQAISVARSLFDRLLNV